MKLTDSQRHTLQNLHDELDFYISASEGEFWPDSITQDAKTFDKLVKLERTTERAFADYFKDLAPRLASAVSWPTYRSKIAADDDPMIAAAAKLIEGDTKILVSVAFKMFEEAENIGAEAAGNINKIPPNFQTLTQVIQRQAIRYSNKFVTDRNDTTLKLLRESLRTSIDLGEPIDDAYARVYQIIDNPVRARMIAHTEPVNSYGRGIQVFGKNTGAKGKVIDAVIDDRTTPICLELQDKYGDEKNAAGIDDYYVWTAAGGGKKQEPGFHINCRTGHYLLY